VAGTKQVVWTGSTRREERDGSGSLANGKQFFALGQINFSGGTGTSYFYEPSTDGPRGVTDSTGTEIASFRYDPYGNRTQLSGSFVPDFGYGGYYLHQPSGLCITETRAYSASLGRFVTRDRIEEKGGLNLYSYVGNDPIGWIDPTGKGPEIALLFTPQGLAYLAGALAAGGLAIKWVQEHGNEVGRHLSDFIVRMNTDSIPDPVDPEAYEEAKQHNDFCNRMKDECQKQAGCGSKSGYGKRFSDCMRKFGCESTGWVPAKGGGWIRPSSKGDRFTDNPMQSDYEF
jgi:RHS repeat-associated protein